MIRNHFFDAVDAEVGAAVEDAIGFFAGQGCAVTEVTVPSLRYGLGAIYAMGTHPVIVNGFCRALGYKRADYRPLLENSGAVPPRKRTRWQKS